MFESAKKGSILGVEGGGPKGWGLLSTIQRRNIVGSQREEWGVLFPVATYEGWGRSVV